MLLAHTAMAIIPNMPAQKVTTARLHVTHRNWSKKSKRDRRKPKTNKMTAMTEKACVARKALQLKLLVVIEESINSQSSMLQA